MANTSVYRKENDPYVYLQVGEKEYKYNPNDKPLGSGAMGVVYLGYDCQNGNKVAVKRVRDEYANMRSVRERAKLEASLTYRHANLVQMLGYCEMEPDRGPIFILSSYVRGVDVRKYIKKQYANAPDRVERICHLISPVLEALSFLHTRGVLHRDVKPSNIMVAGEGNAEIKLMDLGIARQNGGNKFSTVGFVGTPNYAAPEQIQRGVEDDVEMGKMTDIYAMGVTIFELMAGYNPFRGSSEIETLKNQLTRLLPYDPQIPVSVLRVLRHATEKDPMKRIQSADALRVALRDADKSFGLFDKLCRFALFRKFI